MTLKKTQTKAIEAAFSEFTRAWFAGERPDAGRFCKRYPEIEERLKKEIEDFLYVAKNLPEFREKEETGSSTHPPLNDTRWSSTDAAGMLTDFRILNELGRGGMGTVYEAEQISLSRRVALKILPPHMSFSDHAIKKFRREAEAGGRHSHPGIVAVYAVGEENGIHYIAQEPVEGGRTLAHRIETYRRGKPMERGFFRDAAKIITAVADALRHAHAAHVIHRDIKPSNILLTPEGRPKVTDFGLAKIEDALTLSRSNEFAGTPFYMSPEQVARHRMEIDHRTDIYSLGVTLYEMLTLTRPFDGESSQQVMKKILLDEPKDPRDLNPRVPKDLAVICLKCMEKFPGDRYDDMAELEDDIDRYLAGETIKARPAGFITRTGKRFRRNPVVSVALLLIVAALVIVPSVIIYKEMEVDQVKEDRKRAEEEKQAALDDIQSMRLARYSASALTHDPGLALLLGTEAESISSNHFSNDALLYALEACLERRTLFHASKVDHAAFSPDNRFVATASKDLCIRLWNSNGNSVKKRLKRHACPINELNFDHSGNRLVSASDDHTAIIWDMDSGKPKFILKHDKPVLSAAFSPDDRWVVTGSADLTARVWDAETGEQAAPSLVGHRWTIRAVRFGPGGDRVITASEEGVIRIWNWREGTLLHELQINESGARVLCVDLKNDGFPEELRWLIAGTTSGTTWIWELRSDEPPKAIAHDNGEVLDVAFRPGCNQFLTVTSTGSAIVRKFDPNVFDNESKEKILYELKGNHDAVLSGRFDTEGDKVITASWDRTARIFDFGYGENFSLVEREVSEKGYPVFDETSQYMGQVSEDGTTVSFMNVMTNERLSTIDVRTPRIREACKKQFLGNGYRLSPDRRTLFISESDNVGISCDTERIKKLFISPDGRLALTILNRSYPRIWNMLNGKEEHWFHHSGDLQTAEFSPDGSRLAVGLTGKELLLFDTATWKLLVTMNLDSWAESIRYDRSGSRICVLKKAGQASVFDADLKPLYNVPEAEGSIFISDVRFGRDRDELVSVVEDGSARIWSSGKETTSLREESDDLISATFIPNSDWIFTLTRSDSMLVWNADSGKLRYPIRGEENLVTHFTFSPDGQQLVAALKTGYIRYWALKEKPILLRDFKFAHQVGHISFIPNCEDLVVAASDGSIVKRWPKDLYGIALARLPRYFTSAELEMYGIDLNGAVPLHLKDWNPYAINLRAWNIVTDATRDSASYRSALSMATRACESEPKNTAFRITKGIALYRTDKWKDAYDLLSDGALIHAKDSAGGGLSPFFFSIMALLRMDRPDEAKKMYSDLQVRLKDPWEAHFDEYGFMLNELLSFETIRDPVPEPPEKSAISEIEPFAFASETKGSWRIMLYDPATDITQTILESGVKRCGNLMYIPKMDLLFYLEKVNRKRNLRIYDFSRKEDHPASSFAFDASGNFFRHPSRNQIYFSRGQRKEIPHGIDIFRMQIDQDTVSDPVPFLGAPLRTTFMPAVSPDGRHIAFIHFEGNSWTFDQELWIGTLNEEGTAVSKIRQLSSDINPDFACCFSPDNRYLYRFYSLGSESSHIDKIRLDSLENSELYCSSDEISRAFDISPSGYLVLCETDKDHKHSITVIDAYGRVMITLGGEDMDFDSPCFITR